MSCAYIELGPSSKGQSEIVAVDIEIWPRNQNAVVKERGGGQECWKRLSLRKFFVDAVLKGCTSGRDHHRAEGRAIFRGPFLRTQSRTAHTKTIRIRITKSFCTSANDILNRQDSLILRRHLSGLSGL